MKKLSLLLVLGFGLPAFADWPTDAGQDVPCANALVGWRPTVIVDATTGVFVVWGSTDPASDKRLRGEHFTLDGTRLWGTPTADGGYIGRDLLGLSLGTETTSKAIGVTDTDGGIVVVYTAGPTPYTIHGQHFDATGAAHWAPTGAYGGVQLLANPYNNQTFSAASDGKGGAITVVVNGDMYAHRFTATGTTPWGTAGSGVDVGMGQLSGVPYSEQILSNDGNGGLWYIWPFSGSQTQTPWLAHVQPAGTIDFADHDVAPQQSLFGQWAQVPELDGGGVWAAWTTANSPNAFVLQRFNMDGGFSIVDGGAVGGIITATPNAAIYPLPSLVDDGAGGVVQVWVDRLANVNSVLVQRFGPDGTAIWPQAVLASSAATPAQPASSYQPSTHLIVTPDGAVQVFWLGPQSNGVYSTRLSLADGSRIAGPIGGFSVSQASNIFWYEVAGSPEYGSFVVIQDGLSRVLLKRVNADGSLGTPVVVTPDAGVVDAGAGGGAGGGSAATGGGSAETGGGSAATGGGSAATGGGSAATGGGTSGAGGGTAASGGGTSATGGGAATDDGGTGGGTSGGSGCGCTSEGNAFDLVALFALASLIRARRSRR